MFSAALGPPSRPGRRDAVPQKIGAPIDDPATKKIGFLCVLVSELDFL
jgi:hypothetical protein